MTDRILKTTPLYIMESDREGLRQHQKNDEKSTLTQLIESGIENLGNYDSEIVAVEAGSGAGFVSRAMAQLLGRSYKGSKLFLLDLSQQRLDTATSFTIAPSNVKVEPIVCNLEKIPLSTGSADFVYSRFVFEFLQNPTTVFNELVRLTKPGGRLSIGDLDYNSLTHYPIGQDIENKLKELVEAVQALRMFDPYIGRKLYSYFYQAGFTEINVRVTAHHLFYGDLKKSDLDNWQDKLNQIKKLQLDNSLKLSFDVGQFENEFMQFFLSPGRFSYTPLIFVTGVKPK